MLPSLLAENGFSAWWDRTASCSERIRRSMDAASSTTLTVRIPFIISTVAIIYTRDRCCYHLLSMPYIPTGVLSTVHRLDTKMNGAQGAVIGGPVSCCTITECVARGKNARWYALNGLVGFFLKSDRYAIRTVQEQDVPVPFFDDESLETTNCRSASSPSGWAPVTTSHVD